MIGQNTLTTLLNIRVHNDLTDDTFCGTVTGRAAGKVFYNQWIKNSPPCLELKQSLSNRVTYRAFSHTDQVCKKLSHVLCRHKTLISAIALIEDQVLDSWNSLIPETPFIKTLFSTVSKTIGSLSKLAPDASIKNTLASQIHYRLPDVPMEEIEELITDFFSGDNQEFRMKLASKLCKFFRPRLKKALQPIIESAIPYIQELINQVIQKETGGVVDWVGTQISSAVSSSLLTLAALKCSYCFSDSEDDLSSMVILGTTCLANFGLIGFQLLQSSQKTCKMDDLQRMLRGSYGEALKDALANALADFHSSWLSESDIKDDEFFKDMVSDNLVDFILLELTKELSCYAIWNLKE